MVKLTKKSKIAFGAATVVGLGSFGILQANAAPTANPANLRYEVENLSTSTAGNPKPTVAPIENCDKAKCIVVNTKAVGESVTFTLKNVPHKTFTIKVITKKFDTRGAVQLAIKGAPNAQYDGTSRNLGKPQNLYSAKPSLSMITFGKVGFGSAGTKEFKFTVTGKTSASKGFTIGLDAIVLVPDNGPGGMPPVTTPRPTKSTAPTVKPTKTVTPTKTTAPTPKPTTPKPTTGLPGPSNTGVPAGTKLRVHNGDLTVTAPGTVIDSMDIRGYVNVQAANVKITRSIIRGSNPNKLVKDKALIQSTKPGLVIQHTELAPSAPNVFTYGLRGYGFTAQHVNIHDVVDNAVIHGNNTTIENSWLHNNRVYQVDPVQKNGPSHADGIQIEGGSNVKIANNVIEGIKTTGIQVTQNAALVSGLNISGNKFHVIQECGINLADKGKGALRNVVIKGNIFKHGTGVNSNCAVTTAAAPSTKPVLDSNYWANGNSWASSGRLITRTGRNG